MKKAAVIFLIAVLGPSIVLAWLAVRSLRDQQFILERQQALLYQTVADSLAREVENHLAERQREFGFAVESLLADYSPIQLAARFDSTIGQAWPLAEVGFAVSLDGRLWSPSAASGPEARRFRLEHERFLCNVETAEVFSNVQNIQMEQRADTPSSFNSGAQQYGQSQQNPARYSTKQMVSKQGKSAQVPPTPRNVVPQESQSADWSFSKALPDRAEFQEVVGDSAEGVLARFVQNELKLLMWYRSPRDPQIIFGAQLALPRLQQSLGSLVMQAASRQDVCIALLDDGARPVALSHTGFEADWKRPFVAAEASDALPHWEAAVYLLDPGKLTESARILQVTLGSLIALLLLAIGSGGWLIFADVKRQMLLAQQKTDFVSNVSHELKTPLTSIRMFSELLAEGRVIEKEKQRSYLKIITAETARLTRLINNVLDFSRLQRGEKKYDFRPVDLEDLVKNITETFRPQLESHGFTFETKSSGAPLIVHGDRDALSQVIVNLLSNAEKYSSDTRAISVEIAQRNGCAEVMVSDRGMGVPHGCEERIFEQFYRANDSLNSGIQGAGLGLTLARQIARAHGGDLIYRSREEGGSRFTLQLPIRPSQTH